MKILHITLKRKWFDLIAEGIKTHEYREIKPYWIKRLTENFNVLYSDYGERYAFTPKAFDVVSANNGYQKNCPNVQWKHKGIRIGKPNPAWCAPEDVDKTVFILEIGELNSIKVK